MCDDSGELYTFFITSINVHETPIQQHSGILPVFIN